MKAAKTKMPRSKDSPKRGPEPDRLKINMDWKEAIKMSLQKKKPASGWPK
jgi:hypothetical protein